MVGGRRGRVVVGGRWEGEYLIMRPNARIACSFW